LAPFVLFQEGAPKDAASTLSGADGILLTPDKSGWGQSRPLDESELIAAHLSRPDVTVFFHADAQARSEVDEFKNRAIVTDSGRNRAGADEELACRH